MIRVTSSVSVAQQEFPFFYFFFPALLGLAVTNKCRKPAAYPVGNLEVREKLGQGRLHLFLLYAATSSAVSEILAGK